MNTKLPLLISMLLVKTSLGAGQELVGCIPGYFLDNKVCKPCPDQCETCISDRNCTTCERNSYGQTCQLKCDVICEGVCHKTYGHCTFSCRDGHYPVPLSPECFVCPTNCGLCNSSSNCFSCQPGFYGPICEDVCQENCTSSCQKDYGHCTHGCEDGTYHTDNDTCLHCQPSCELCRSKNDCLRRKSGISVTETTRHDQRNSTEDLDRTVPIIAIVTASIIVFCIPIVAFVIYRRKKRSECTECLALARNGKEKCADTIVNVTVPVTPPSSSSLSSSILSSSYKSSSTSSLSSAAAATSSSAAYY